MTLAPGRPPIARPPFQERIRAPESIAAALSALVLVAVMAAGPLGGSSRPPATSPPGSAAPSATLVPQTTSGVDPTVVEVLTAVNDRLAAIGSRLDELATAANPSAAEIATAIRELNATARNGPDLVPQLARQPGGGLVANRLATFYASITQAAEAALQVTITNAQAYREAAAGLVVILGDLPELQADIQALLLVPAPGGSATPGASPSSPVASAAATATPATTPGGSAAPSPTATPIPGGPELLIGGSFDEGAGPPWRLAVEAGVTATVTTDTTQVVSPPAAARVDIATATTSRSGVALQQAGVPLDAGATYLFRVQLTAASDREVVLRVASTVGVTYGARAVTVTPGWAVYELAFTAPIGDQNAVVTLELGRSTVTTWVDDASFREVNADFVP